MAVKTHTSEKHITVRCDEYKCLDNQMDMLAYVIETIGTIPQGRQTQQNRPYKPYIHKGGGHGIDIS